MDNEINTDHITWIEPFGYQLQLLNLLHERNRLFNGMGKDGRCMKDFFPSSAERLHTRFWLWQLQIMGRSGCRPVRLFTAINLDM